jgi:hypothetical protein
MKNIDTTYHIDYTFVSRPDAVEGVTVGSMRTGSRTATTVPWRSTYGYS